MAEAPTDNRARERRIVVWLLIVAPIVVVVLVFPALIALSTPPLLKLYAGWLNVTIAAMLLVPLGFLALGLSYLLEWRSRRAQTNT